VLGTVVTASYSTISLTFTMLIAYSSSAVMKVGHRFTACGKTRIYAGFWEGHDFTGCGETPVSYQGIASAIP
jgi:hypothetical protein